MPNAVICLSGWHPDLCRAECLALIASSHVQSVQSRRFCSVSDVDLHHLDSIIEVASGVQCVLIDGECMPWRGVDTPLLALVETYLASHEMKGKVAVNAWRLDGKLEGFATSEVAGKIGGLLSRAGYCIQLTNQDHTFAIIADASTSTVAFGWMTRPEIFKFGGHERRAGERPFFKPVSLDPKLARAAVNLACGPLHHGSLIDPMTGTGGFIIEAELSGRKGIGFDANSDMVHGAQRNLAWAQASNDSQTCLVLRGDATVMEASLPPTFINQLFGFTLDPPYGRNSHGTVHAEGLIRQTLRSAHGIANEGAHFVIILPARPSDTLKPVQIDLKADVSLLYSSWTEMLEMCADEGWLPIDAYAERVHGSLSRVLLRLQFSPLS